MKIQNLKLLLSSSYWKDNWREYAYAMFFITIYLLLAKIMEGAITLFHIIIIISIILVRIFMGKEFLKDWFPIISFFIMYDMLRAIADDNRYIYVKEPFEAEQLFFAPFFGGNIPSFWLDRIQNPVITAIAAFLYSLHIFMPIFLGYLLWRKEETRKQFFEFAWTLTLTSYFALFTFWLFPVAPPWWIWSHGFAQPDTLMVSHESAAGLKIIDKMIGFNLFSNIYGTLNSNPFAAVPSLHAAYSFLVAFFAIRNYGKKGSIAIIYPIGIYFSALYLKHHYLIDLILGTVYALIATYIATRLVYKPQPRKVMDNEGERPIEEIYEEKYPLTDQIILVGHNR